MRALLHTRVLARVRLAGTERRLELRTFDFMLCPSDDLTKQRAEAARIARQIGYDVAPGSVSILPPGVQP